nr:hypothetical protein [Providencia sp. PROV266]
MNNITLNTLLANNLFINNTWVDKSKISNVCPSQKNKFKVKCKNSDNYCLVTSGIKRYQILAIYIQEIYGDGIYYCQTDDKNSELFYFLIIKNGNVACETDCIINREMLDFLLSGIDSSEYKNLMVVELTKTHFSKIIDEYELIKRIFSKKRKQLSILISGLFLIFSLISLFIADYLLNGWWYERNH